MTRPRPDPMDLFARALERPAAERTAFVAAEAAGDEALRRQVTAMLQADAGAAPLLDAAPDELAAAVSEGPPPSLVGRRLGPYTVVEMLGQGGMGIVCLAEREDVGKQAALKLVAGGLAEPERINRFLHERRLLAQLEHPRIARLLDAGVAEDGTPWFAMEYVPGLPIDRYSDGERSTVDERLRLFEQVCDAVAYAHRHLIVHRDLKPTNILVTADGEPRLLDFGIAKLLDDSGGARGPVTVSGLRLMTPQYASPEQLRGGPITTASDVYQLGALLFELLTGEEPHPSGDAQPPGPEREVPKPSLAVARRRQRSSPAAAAIAEARRTTPERLRRSLAGDLDNIVRKATRLEPDRRYATAEQLGADVRRHREGLPVQARPATLPYRIGKFVHRHRAGTGVAGLLLVAALGYGVLATRTSRRVAAQRIQAEQVADLLQEIFAGADPTETQGDTVRVGDVLDRGAERVRTGLTASPVVKARLLEVIARAYRNLGRRARSVALLTDAVGTIRRATSRQDSTRLAMLTLLGVWQAEARADPAAQATLGEALRAARRLGHGRRAELALVLRGYGYARQVAGDDAAARAAYEESLAIGRTLDDDLGQPIDQLIVNLGYLATNRGDWETAERYWRDALARREASLGPDHPLVAGTMTDVARALLERGAADSAAPLIERAIAIQRRVFSGPHPDLAAGLAMLARARDALGQSATAESLFRASLAQQRLLHGDTSLAVMIATADMAGIIQHEGRLDEAAALYDSAVSRFTAALGPRNPSTAVTMTNLAYTELLRGNLPRADSLYRRAVPVLDSAWRGTPRVSTTLVDHGEVLARSGDCPNGIPLFKRAIQLRRDALLPENIADRVRPRILLGECEGAMGHFAAAESLLVAGYREMLAAWGPDNRFTLHAANDLRRLYLKWGRPDEAARYDPEGSAKTP